MTPRFHVGRVVFPFALAAAVYVLTGFLPKTYATTQTLYFPMSQSPASGAGSALGLTLPGSGSDGTAVTSLGGALQSPLVGAGVTSSLAIINSQTCMFDVVDRLGLAKEWKLNRLQAARKLRSQIVADVDKAGLLSISVNAASPEKSAQINRALLSHLRRRASELSVNVSKRNRQFIEQRLQNAVAKLDREREAVSSALADHPASDFDETQRLFFAARQKVDAARVQQATASGKLASLRDQYVQLSRQSDASDVRTVAIASLNRGFGTLAEELQKRRIQLEDALEKFADGSPQLQSAREAYQSAEKVSKSVLGTQSQPANVTASPDFIEAQSELVALNKAVSASEAILRKYEDLVKLAPEQYATVAIERQRFEDSIRNVSTLRAELERAKIAEERDPSLFEVVDPPVLDPVPVAPRRLVMTAFAFIVGGILSLLPTISRAVLSKPSPPIRSTDPSV